MGKHRLPELPDETSSNVIDFTTYRLQRQVWLLGLEGVVGAEAYVDEFDACTPEYETPAIVIDISNRVAERNHQPTFSHPRLQGIIDRFGIDVNNPDFDYWKRPDS